MDDLQIQPGFYQGRFLKYQSWKSAQKQQHCCRHLQKLSDMVHQYVQMFHVHMRFSGHTENTLRLFAKSGEDALQSAGLEQWYAIQRMCDIIFHIMCSLVLVYLDIKRKTLDKCATHRLRKTLDRWSIIPQIFGIQESGQKLDSSKRCDESPARLFIWSKLCHNGAHSTCRVTANVQFHSWQRYAHWFDVPTLPFPQAGQNHLCWKVSGPWC